MGRRHIERRCGRRVGRLQQRTVEQGLHHMNKAVLVARSVAAAVFRHAQHARFRKRRCGDKPPGAVIVGRAHARHADLPAIPARDRVRHVRKVPVRSREMSFWQSWVMVTGCENVISTVVLFTVFFDLRNRERHVIGGCKYVVAVYAAGMRRGQLFPVFNRRYVDVVALVALCNVAHFTETQHAFGREILRRGKMPGEVVLRRHARHRDLPAIPHTGVRQGRIRERTSAPPQSRRPDRRGSW